MVLYIHITTTMRYFLFLSFLLFQSILFGQNKYGLIDQGASVSPKCVSCLTTIQNMPSEVIMGLKMDEFNKVYFIMTDVDWFNELFSKSTMGVAVDILVKTDFECGERNTKTAEDVARGELMEPVYQRALKEKAQISPDGTVLVDLGLLPKSFRGEEFEINLMVLNKKTVCYYTSFYNIKRYKWGLLSMGLYTDTILDEPENVDSTIELRNTRTTTVTAKKLDFTIPFEKNKSNYTKEDLLPLYDSMSLNLYDIQRIKIRAYSSVEGSKANNIRLQEMRAKSIVDALQEFQSDEIVYDISSAENWLEFYDDIKGTAFQNLSDLSKEAVKNKLTNKEFSAKMEPILGKHRKAVVSIEIEKKTTFKGLTEQQIVVEFNKSISNNDMETAKELMNLAYQRVINGESPNDFLGKLEVPKQKEYGLLYNRRAVFEYFLDEEDLEASYNNFLELKELMPKSKEVNYNIISLKFKLWLSGVKEIDPKTLEREIRGLALFGVSTELINRMIINLNIIQSEINMVKRDYKAKDRNLKNIFYKYKSIKPNPQDILKLAQYYVAYGKYDWATKLIKPYIGTVDTDEDLLFYYINLTVVDRELANSKAYKKILLNAIDVNNERFCTLFNSGLMDGISFQLLDIPALKENYCESCQ